MIRSIQFCVVLFAAVATTALPCCAQVLTGPPADPDLEHSTPLPPGVAAPDQLPTRFGTLQLFDGVPSGYHVVQCTTFHVWPVWRSFVVDGDPKPGVDAVKKFTKVYRLDQADNPPVLKFVDMSGKPFNMVGPADFSFWEMLNQVVQEEPIDTVDATRSASGRRSASRRASRFSPTPA